jgi:hypothetical protein
VIEIEAYGTRAQIPGAFGKVGPANGTGQGVAGAMTLTWQQSSGATSYEYCYDLVDDAVCNGSWVSTTAASAAIMVAGDSTPVFWQVRARNGAGVTEADNGAWWRFTTSDAARINLAAAASGATATASSSYSSGFAPSSVIDGDRRGTAWGAGGGWADSTPDQYPDWLKVDFAGPQTVAEIDVFTLQDNFVAAADPTPGMTFSIYGVTDFQVQYWTGAIWANVPGGQVTGNNQVWRQFTFPAVTTTAIRVVVTGTLMDYSRLIEIEAYASSR